MSSHKIEDVLPERADIITQAGEDMYLVWMHVDDMQEQEINPQIMEKPMFDQLTTNVSNRGALESVPFVAVPDGREKPEIVSGHKRVRAARLAGMEKVIVLLDVSGLSRSAVAAKVLAHNNIHGYSDEQTMARLAEEIKSVEDRLEAFLPEEMDEIEDEKMEPLIAPRIDFDWRTITLAFISEQLEEFDELIDTLSGRQDLVGVDDVANFQAFREALNSTARVKEVKSVSQVVVVLIQAALKMAEEQEEIVIRNVEFSPLYEVFGTTMIPQDLAEKMTRLAKKYRNSDEPWHAYRDLWDAYEKMGSS